LLIHYTKGTLNKLIETFFLNFIIFSLLPKSFHYFPHGTNALSIYNINFFDFENRFSVKKKYLLNIIKPFFLFKKIKSTTFLLKKQLKTGLTKFL